MTQTIHIIIILFFISLMSHIKITKHFFINNEWLHKLIMIDLPTLFLITNLQAIHPVTLFYCLLCIVMHLNANAPIMASIMFLRNYR